MLFGLRNVVLATDASDASDTMDYEKCKHINTGRNPGRDVTSSQGVKTQAGVFWSCHLERRPREDVQVWNEE